MSEAVGGTGGRSADGPDDGYTAVSRRARDLARSFGWFGSANVLANLLGYVATIVLSRGLSPAEFGAAGALLAVGMLAAVPASTLQLVVASRVARAVVDTTISVRQVSPTALLIGAFLTLLAAIGLRPLSDYLHLASSWPALMVVLTLGPTAVGGAYQGLLLGHGAFNRLAVAIMVTATSRVVAMVLALSLGAGLTGVLAAICAASVLSALVTAWLARARSEPARAVAPMWRDLAHGSVLLTGFFVLSNLDIPLARHQLGGSESGLYVLGAIFAKACLWGPQFLAVLAYPRLARSSDPRRVLLVVMAMVAGLGLLAAAAAAVAGGWLAVAMSGPEYAGVGRLAAGFAVLGTLWALLHVVVLSHIANAGRLASAGVWVAVAAEVAVIHRMGASATPGSILAVAVGAAAGAVLLASVPALRGAWPPDREAPGTPDLAELALPDGPLPATATGPRAPDAGGTTPR